MGDIWNKPNRPESYKAAEKQKNEVTVRFTEERIEEATRVWALNNERLYHHEKERLYHLPHIQQELDARREELIDSFSKQNVLLIGPPGAGKSSIINSFNYVVSLAADKDALFEEIAEVGGNMEETKTRHLLHYDATVGGMYKALLQSPNDEHRKKAQVGPTLIDTPGLPDRRDLEYLLQALVLGDIPIESDLKFCMSFKANNYKHFKRFVKSASEKKVDAKAACVVLLVIQNSSLKKKAELPFPSELVHALSNVLFQTPGVRIFVALTKIDKITGEVVNSEIEDTLIEILRIGRHRIFEISNFSSDNEDAVGQMQPHLEKQIRLVSAFREILAVNPK